MNRIDIEAAKASFKEAMAYSGYGPLSSWAAKHGFALLAELEQLRAILPLARLGEWCAEFWPEGAPDGGDLQDALREQGLIYALPGGFDPATHHGDAEPGVEWLEPTRAFSDAVKALIVLGAADEAEKTK